MLSYVIEGRNIPYNLAIGRRDIAGTRTLYVTPYRHTYSYIGRKAAERRPVAMRDEADSNEPLSEDEPFRNSRGQTE